VSPPKPTNLKDLIRVVATIHDIDKNKYFIEVEYRGVEGQLKRTMLPRSLMRSGTRALERLLDEGAILPSGKAAATELLNVLGAGGAPIIRITGRVGWHGRSFVLPDVTIGPDAETLKFRGGEALPKVPHLGGSPEAWRAQLGPPCLASSYLTFAIALEFAGPLLELVGQDEGGSFYWSGESSTGKTLSELAGQSVIGYASRKTLLTHDASDRAFEEFAAAHNDLVLIVDEIDRTAGSDAERRKHVRQLGHKLAGGAGRKRSAVVSQDGSLPNLLWRLFSLWSGEYTLDECLLGGVRRRGEIVRLVEIPVPPKERGGVFNLTRASSFELAAAVEGAIKTNFGHAIRAYLDREFWTQRAKLLVDRFIRKVGATSDPWTLRLATKFAIVYAGGRIAAEMNIAPWPKRHPFKCIASAKHDHGV
jgi:uncharacterized protein (DUF927 family)